MNHEIFNRIKRFTVDHAAVEEDDVTEDASLENDLGVYGDDAAEFIVAFGKELMLTYQTLWQRNTLAQKVISFFPQS